MRGISLCASGITVLLKVARSPQMKPRGLGSTEEALGSFACAPLGIASRKLPLEEPRPGVILENLGIAHGFARLLTPSPRDDSIPA
jgi:hypothetical protein